MMSHILCASCWLRFTIVVCNAVVFVTGGWALGLGRRSRWGGPFGVSIVGQRVQSLAWVIVMGTRFLIPLHHPLPVLLQQLLSHLLILVRRRLICLPKSFPLLKQSNSSLATSINTNPGMFSTVMLLIHTRFYQKSSQVSKATGSPNNLKTP